MVNEIVEKIKTLVPGLDLVCAEHGQNCDPHITSDEIITLTRDYEQVKAALAALVAAMEDSGEIWTGGDALAAAKSLLPAEESRG